MKISCHSNCYQIAVLFKYTKTKFDNFMNSSSLDALEGFIWTTFDTVSDVNFVKMTIYPFKCIHGIVYHFSKVVEVCVSFCHMLRSTLQIICKIFILS